MSYPQVETKKEEEAVMEACISKDAEHAVMYEANIRQYSRKGTFEDFTKDIPKIKKLGVKFIWVMPIQPISMKRRKTASGKFIEEIEDPKEKEKQLGSYYSIANYTAVNQNFGTLEDFKKLVKTAHKHDMYVILDWVANHTGWDHKWIEEHPEFYYKNGQGEVTEPLKPWDGQPEGWGDVAHLNYDNDALFEVMKDEMKFWVEEADIDGFRCDVAERVRLEFWEYVYPELNKVKPVFMLMEADNPDYMNNVFDAGYNWKTFHVMNEIAQGKMNAKDFAGELNVVFDIYKDCGIPLNFTSNHDENSWLGSEYERLGNAVETFAALTFVIPGMPLIYNGQEYDSHKRLKFFEKDTFSRRRRKMFKIYEKLGKLKNENLALNGKVEKASYERIHTSDDERFLAFRRENEGQEVIFIGNLSNSFKSIPVPVEGEFENYMMGKSVEVKKGEEIEFEPWEYWILVK